MPESSGAWINFDFDLGELEHACWFIVEKIGNVLTMFAHFQCPYRSPWI